MAGGQTLGADLARHAEKRLELHVRVAVGAGDGRAAGEILIDERAHDALLELLLEVHDVMRKIQVLRDALGVVDIVERAAAVLLGTVALEFGEAALVPELHREADDGVALLLKDGGDGGGIDAAGHGDRDQAALGFLASRAACRIRWRRSL